MKDSAHFSIKRHSRPRKTGVASRFAGSYRVFAYRRIAAKKNCGDNLGASGGLVQCFLAIASEQAKSVRAWRVRCYFMQKRQRVAILGVDRPLLTGFREIKARQAIE